MTALTSSTDPASSPALLTVKEACDVLRISRSTYYGLVHRRELQTIKLGSKRLVTADAIEQLIARLQHGGGNR